MFNSLLAAVDAGTIAIIIDVAVCLILIIYALVGLSKGFFNCLLKIFGTLGAVVIAVLTAKPVLSFVNGIVDISAACGKWMSSYFVGGGFETEVTSANIGTMGETVAATDIFEPLKTLLRNIVEKAEVTGETTTTLGELCGSALGHIVASIFVGIALFIIIKVIVALLSKLFDDASSKNNALNGLDKLLGLVFGTVKGLVFLGLAIVITNFLCYIPAVNNVVTENINNTKVTKIAYNFATEKVDEFMENMDWNKVIGQLFNRPEEAPEDENPAPEAAFVITVGE